MKLLHWFPLLPSLLPGLLPSLISLWLVAPAQAGEVTTWRYDSDQNRLEFTTDQDVQPRAQLVFDPTRLVIDLPGTSVGQAPVNQTVGGAIRQVRVGQLDTQTTRIVVELAPGYTLDPQQVRFRGVSPTQWTVQLPQPQLTQATAPSPTVNPAGSTTTSTSETPDLSAASPSSSQSRARAAGSNSANNSTRSTDRSAAMLDAERINAQNQRTQINGIEVTDGGLLINTEGSTPKLSIERSRRGGSITVRFDTARLSPHFRGREREIDRHGVDDLEIQQDNETVEITLDVSRRSPDWQAQVGEQGRILLLPQTAAAATPTPTPTATRTTPIRTAQPRPLSSASSSAASSATPAPAPARPVVTATSTAATVRAVTATPTPATLPTVQQTTVQGIDLDVSGSQLLIQTDRPVSHQAQWQGGMYVVTLAPARLAERVSGPQLTPVDPLRRVRLRQVDDQTVAISIQPATGVQFGSLNLVTPQMLALEMRRPSAAQSTPSTGLAANSSVRPLPNVIPNGRIVVVIDPGHGGRDPGAVGIGNLQEAPIALAISQQVATLLQQQGIQAVLTRSSDVEVELEPRVQMAEQIRANLFVSIHANSMGMERPDVNGIETYYYSNGEALASVIQNSIVSSLDMRDRGVKQARFYVLRHTSMPAVLVETGYVTGEEDAPRLADASFRNQMAIAIARGILQYIQQNSLTGSR